MVETLKRISIFLSSPSDVSDEREMAKKLVDEINLDLGYRGKYHVELLTWETHTSSGVAESAQVVISKDIGSSYDIYLGVMRSKFGTPIGDFGSGTAYEYNDALRRRNAGEDVEIMFFFFSGEIKISPVDLSQIANVFDFKAGVGKEGGVRYTEYGSLAEYSVKLRRELIHRIQDFLERNKEEAAGEDAFQVDLDRLSNYNKLIASNANAAIMVRSDSVVGKLRRATKGLEDLADRTHKMTSALSKTVKHIAAFSSPGKTPNVGSTIESINKTGNIVFSTVKFFRELMSGEWEGDFIDALSETQRIAYIALDSKIWNNSDITVLVEPLQKLRAGISGGGESLQGMVSEIDKIPMLPVSEGTNLFTSIRLHRAVSLDLKLTMDRMVEAIDETISSLVELEQRN